MSINSSVNFLIYCIFGNKFKTIFMQIFCGQKPRVQTVRTGLEYRRSQLDNSSACRAVEIHRSALGGSNGGFPSFGPFNVVRSRPRRTSRPAGLRPRS